MFSRETLRERIRLGVDDEIDIALAPERDVFRAVLGDRLETHGAEQLAQLFRLRMGVFDEFETSVPIGFTSVIAGGRRIVRKRTHELSKGRLVRQCEHIRPVWAGKGACIKSADMR